MDKQLVIELVLILALAGLIPAYVARLKRLSFWKWWIYGALLPIVAIPHMLTLHLGQGTRKCPFCNRTSPASAEFCRSCGFEFM